MKRVGCAAAVLVVTLWGCWTAAPRVWCSAPGGHGAVEFLFSVCCQDPAPACPSGTDPDGLPEAAEPGCRPVPESSAVPIGEAGCTDTLLASLLLRTDRGPVLPTPACGGGLGIGGRAPSTTVPLGALEVLGFLRDESPPSCRGFRVSLRI